MTKKTLLQERQRSPEYQDVEIKLNTKKVALVFLSHLGFIENPCLYTLLTTGWTERELGTRIGLKNPAEKTSFYVFNPGAMPHKYFTKIVMILSDYTRETTCSSKTQQSPVTTHANPSPSSTSPGSPPKKI